VRFYQVATKMEHQFETGDIVVGILAAAGVVVLVAVFVWVVRQVMSGDRE
jgi:hypothetical protein